MNQHFFKIENLAEIKKKTKIKSKTKPTNPIKKNTKWT